LHHRRAVVALAVLRRVERRLDVLEFADDLRDLLLGGGEVPDRKIGLAAIAGLPGTCDGEFRMEVKGLDSRAVVAIYAGSHLRTVDRRA